MLIVSKQVMDIINVMPSNKAPGIDKVCQLKSLRTACWSHSLLIINASVLSLTFPGVWKTAEITPIPKQGYLHCQRFAREWLIISLSPIWQKRKGLPQNKATKKWFSTEISLMHTTDAFLEGIDKKLTACVLLNLSKAFRQRWPANIVT